MKKIIENINSSSEEATKVLLLPNSSIYNGLKLDSTLTTVVLLLYLIDDRVIQKKEMER